MNFWRKIMIIGYVLLALVLAALAILDMSSQPDKPASAPSTKDDAFRNLK